MRIAAYLLLQAGYVMCNAVVDPQMLCIVEEAQLVITGEPDVSAL